ncbi:hypothetical protein [uncultured Nitrosomonas sp.]|uniref:hypothetical protein n=1 Tax=uncultured Nitrosomonas sp. TaxID=156424 RepID=UPI0025F7A4E2|nr:hypothetical protein [uncultured Nitrosomonas sp.]
MHIILFRIFPLLLLLAFGLPGSALYAQAIPQVKPQINDSAVSNSVKDTEATGKESTDQLSAIMQSLQEKRKQRKALQQQLAKATQEDEKKDLQQRIDELKAVIKQLNHSFEQVIIGGLDLDPFLDASTRPFDWKEELILATKPIIDALKDLTEKPRKIEKLRGDISLLHEQRKLIDLALDAMARFQPDTMAQPTKQEFESVTQKWLQRQADNIQDLEIARSQLVSLEESNKDWWQSLKTGMVDFVQGRGLTLTIAILTAFTVWMLMRGLLWLYQKKLVSPGNRNSIKVRLAGYAYRMLTGLLVILAVLITFYLANDFLLLTLAIILLIAIALSLRHILPRYINETRLLLDIGPVRIGERVVYNGLPMQVRSINVHSLLRNPDLKGIVRLPLNALDDMVSRPDIDEPWFPCRPGEYVMLSDGRFGEVLEQTLELVLLQMKGSLVQFPAADFFRLDLLNLSRKGFVVVVTFGIDYQHQAQCLDEVPTRFREALEHALAQAEFSDKIVSLLVEFKEANTNSLDYLIVVNCKGEAASSYFTINRLIQKTCVEVCNREHWVIPFTQLTVHQGEGFQALSDRNMQIHQQLNA